LVYGRFVEIQIVEKRPFFEKSLIVEKIELFFRHFGRARKKVMNPKMEIRQGKKGKKKSKQFSLLTTSTIFASIFCPQKRCNEANLLK